MRKHLRNKRLESLKQLGSDRIVKLQFGTNEAAYHIIIELYDRGNIILTDHEMVILYVLRPHVEGEEVRFAVKEKYPTDRAREKTNIIPTNIEDILVKESQKKGATLKKALISHLGKYFISVKSAIRKFDKFYFSEFGPALTEHVILEAGFSSNAKLGKDVDISRDLETIVEALKKAQEIMENAKNVPSKVSTFR